MIMQSQANQTIQYETQPSVVAQVCQEVLARLGKITTASIESGIIAGKIGLGGDSESAFITLWISPKDRKTELHIQCHKEEMLVASGGAQGALAVFTAKLGGDPRLAGQTSQ